MGAVYKRTIVFYCACAAHLYKDSRETELWVSSEREISGAFLIPPFLSHPPLAHKQKGAVCLSPSSHTWTNTVASGLFQGSCPHPSQSVLPSLPRGPCEHLSQAMSLLYSESSWAPTSLRGKAQLLPVAHRPCMTCPIPFLPSPPLILHPPPPFTLLQPQGPPCNSSNTLGTVWPQGLCAGCSPSLEYTSSDFL